MYYTISNEYLQISVAEEGAQLLSLRGSDGTEYLWQGDPAFWADRSPNLFPYVGRMPGETYYIDNREYHMPIHGFANFQPFRLVEKNDSALVFELTDNPDTYAMYPRHFSYRVRYQLKGKCLQVEYSVENRDEKILHFGLGGHPGFQVPLAEGLAFEDYHLRFGAACQPLRVEFDSKCFVLDERTPFPLKDNTILPLRHDLFDQDAIFLQNTATSVSLETPLDAHGLTVDFWGAKYLGLWHKPHAPAPYVCIEPWTSLPSRSGIIEHLETQPDLLHLEPGGCFQAGWSVTVY